MTFLGRKICSAWGAKQNIAKHYDISMKLYEQMLGPTMQCLGPLLVWLFWINSLYVIVMYCFLLLKWMVDWDEVHWWIVMQVMDSVLFHGQLRVFFIAGELVSSHWGIRVPTTTLPTWAWKQHRLPRCGWWQRSWIWNQVGDFHGSMNGRGLKLL